MEDNQAVVKEMIEQIRARLIDLEEIVEVFEGDLDGYAEKLDRVDDKVYLIERELEAKSTQAAGSKADDAKGEEEAAAESDADAEDTATDGDVAKADETVKAGKAAAGDAAGTNQMKETVSDLNVIYKEGKQTWDELSEALTDIKAPFDKLSSSSTMFRPRRF